MKIIIVGSGFAGVSFAEKLRNLTSAPEIVLITHESDGFYSRPLLSHGFSKQGIEQAIILKSFEEIEAKNIQIFAGTEVTRVDRSSKSIQLANGLTLAYDRLILAQGSSAFIPPPFLAFRDQFYLFNSLTDLKKLRALRNDITKRNSIPNWAIIGGGLIGCEVSSDLALAGDKVTLYHAMDRLMERQLDIEDSAKLLTVLTNSGIKVLFNQTVQTISAAGHTTRIQAGNSEEFDAVIVSCGFKPRTDLAAAAGITVNRGILVNSQFQTNDPDIFAIGDVAELPDGKLYAFILPIRSQANWLAQFLAGEPNLSPWTAPNFKPKAKVHHFEADHPKPF